MLQRRVLKVWGWQLKVISLGRDKRRRRKRRKRCSATGARTGEECPELKGGASANAATHGDDSYNSSDVLVVSNMRSTKAEAWMLDSTCSFHATPNREWFSSYKSGEFGLAYVSDDTGYRVAGVGDICRGSKPDSRVKGRYGEARS